MTVKDLLEAIFVGPLIFRIFTVLLIILMVFWFYWHKQLSQNKPDLDLSMFNYGKNIVLSKGSLSFKFEPIVNNNGQAVARYINLHVKFPNQLTVQYNTAMWQFYRENNYNVLEYNGGIQNIINPKQSLGLHDLVVVIPENSEGTINIPYWIVCEYMPKKEGVLSVDVK